MMYRRICGLFLSDFFLVLMLFWSLNCDFWWHPNFLTMEVEDGEMNQGEPGGEEEFSGVAGVSWKNCKLKKD